MKKLLLASTALVMSAGVAAADVAVSGNARMGVVYDGDDFGFNSRLRVVFTLSGETDTGLAFGGTIRADNAGQSGGGGVDTQPTMNAGNVFISGAFGRLTMGDVSGAAEFVVGDLADVGLTGLRFLNENEYLSNVERPAARYDINIDGLVFAISTDEPRASNTMSVAVGYTFENFGAGIGYERESSDLQHAIAYVSAGFEGINVKATYGRATEGAFERKDQYGLSVSTTIDQIGVAAFARRGFDDGTNYGVGASYSLGGGATVRGGVVRDGTESQTIADLGLAFTF